MIESYCHEEQAYAAIQDIEAQLEIEKNYEITRVIRLSEYLLSCFN